MSHPSGIVQAAAEVQERLTEARFEFYIIGGLALQHWGEPRFTQDVDLTLLCPFDDERATARQLTELIPPRIEGAVDFAEEARVYLGQTSRGIPVDVAFGGIEFEHRAFERSVAVRLGDEASIRICSAEDLVVMKAFANRTRDWADIEAVLIRRGRHLDLAVIENELQALLAIRGGEEVWNRLVSLKEKYL